MQTQRATFAFYTALILATLLLSCTKETKPEVIAHSATQKSIIKVFNAARTMSDRGIDSSTVTRIEKIATKESAEFQAMAHIISGIYYSGQSSYELGKKHFEKGLKKARQAESDTLKAFALTGIGNGYRHTGDYPKAQRYLYDALRIFENRRDSISIGRVTAFIGELHLQKADLKAAKENLETALRILDRHKAETGWLSAAHTLANVYGMSGDYESALKLDEIGIRISDSIRSPRTKSTFYDNKANCYLFSGKLDSADYYFNECLKLDLASGSKKQIADSYSNLGNLASFRGDHDKGIALTLKSIDILKDVNNKFNLGKSYQILSEIYERKGDHKNALAAERLFFEEYKKLVNEKKEASLAEFRILHETDRKERELAENRLKLVQKDAEVRNRNNLLIVLSLLVFFIALVGLLINRQQKMKNRQLAQEHELKTAIAQIETQNKLQQQRLEISRDLHDNIGAQLTFIISSVDDIKYAFDLKNAKLDDKLQNISVFAKETIIELRDTIWAMNHSTITLEELRSRIMNFIEKAKEANGLVSFKFNMPESLQDVPFTSLIGMNIYRTVQEAIHNAIKYSGARDIVIDVAQQSVSDRALNITVRDNGRGFSTADVARGNGIGNMEKRIADIGGTLTITSEAGTGTTVEITLPGKSTAQL
ncbi:hypothetical protein FLLO111716_08540 [Flavobacterium longum]|uniref:tetratricopeptide repeat-containing sensor histidine kinase n=1 Tax=Flavobacterium longum TaxID=1299340 RepID=UPI0039E7BBC2